MSSTQPTSCRALASTTLAGVFRLIEEKVLEGLSHGFFSLSIEGVIGNGERREVTIRSGTSHRFVIRNDDLPG